MQRLTDEQYELLTKVEAMLSDPLSWCSGALVKQQANGRIQHCTVGAWLVSRETTGPTQNEYSLATRELSYVLGLENVVAWNDAVGYEHVIRRIRTVLREERTAREESVIDESRELVLV